MQIRRPRGITVPQLMIVTALGVLGGVYIWQPLIIKYKNENKSSKPTTGTVATMNLIRNLKQYSNTTTGLMVIGIGATLIVGGSYRFFVKPLFDRRRRQEAESVADYIFQNELKYSTSES